MKRALRKFARDRRGNIAVIFAVSSTALLSAVAGGIDYSRSIAIAVELQAALDTGVLAAASLTQDRDPEAVVRAYVEAAMEEHPDLIDTVDLDVVATITLNSREVAASAELLVPTTFLGMTGIDTLLIRRNADAIEQVRDIEVSLVLDTSGSMSGGKITALRDAAEEFIEVVLASNPERTSVSVIPYNGGVRLPPVVNESVITGGLSARDKSGCPELGTANPITIDLARNAFDWLEWNGQDQRDNRNSSHCPRQSAESVFLSNDMNALTGLVSGLPASGNTGLDVATAWGARALDPAWRGRLGGGFPDRPADYSKADTIKVLVVMTDGEATAQIRTRWNEDRDRWQNYNLYSAATARANMAAACDGAEDNGVHVYTIAFQLNGSTATNLMRNCASRPQNFFEVEDMDIRSAFSAIAADINQLRLTT